MRNLTELAMNRRSPEAVLANLLLKDETQSQSAGIALLRDAQSFGQGLKNYLNLAIDPRMSETRKDIAESGMSGFEAALAYLNLPVQNNFKEGIVLQAAAQTFTTYAGTRALFPEVVDTMFRWATREANQFEKIEAIVSGSRPVSMPQMIWYILGETDSETDTYRTSTVAEGGRVPVRAIRDSEKSVKFFKHGSGYEFTYEFLRRAALDLITPFSARVQRQLEKSKVYAATLTMVNGDGVNGAAPVVNQSSFGGTNNGAINYDSLLMWLVNRAEVGAPVDTVIGNFATYVKWLKLFYAPVLHEVTSGGVAMTRDSAQEALSKAGVNIARLPILDINVTFAISSAMPNDQLLGITKAETIEELVEANSLISESETAIKNQVVTYVRTENTGYRMPFGDTRSIYNFAT